MPDFNISVSASELNNAITKANAAAPQSTTFTKSETNTLLAGKADLVDGKVPAAQLPSYVDDTVEGYYYNGNFYEDSEHITAIIGEGGKIYIDLTTNKSYRWTGNVYTRIDECPAFGETAGTIYEGNKGKANADAIAKKPGEITTGKQYTIDGQTVTAGPGAEAFNNLASNKASGPFSHAEGVGTTASGLYSHTEGGGTTASGAQCHAEGGGTTASGVSSHAEGDNTTASGANSHSEGTHTKATSENQHVQGKFNEEDANDTYAFIIGNGTADNARHNAFAIDWNGLIYVNGVATGVNVATLATDLAALTARVEALENQ